MNKLLSKFPRITGPLRSFYNMYFGEKEIKAIFKLLDQNKNQYIFFDVGANYGIYTFLFSKNSLFTYVFEPIEECIEYIRRGCRYKNVSLVNKAVSNSKKEQFLNIPLENGNKIFGKSSFNKSFNKSEQRKVECTKLDNFIKETDKYIEKVLFIKIDVEGHENKVIDGGINLIKNRKSLLLIEIEHRHNQDFNYIFQKLSSLNFHTYIYQNNKFVDVDTESKLEEAMRDNNNFIFKNY